jgi:hypothetical protein
MRLKLLDQAKKALSRGDIEGAAAMRMTAADEFRSISP